MWVNAGEHGNSEQLQKWSGLSTIARQFHLYATQIEITHAPPRRRIRSRVTYNNWQWRRRESKKLDFRPFFLLAILFFLRFSLFSPRLHYLSTSPAHTHLYARAHTHCRHLPRTTRPLSKCLCTDRCSIPSGSPAFRSRGTPRPI